MFLEWFVAKSQSRNTAHYDKSGTARYTTFVVGSRRALKDARFGLQAGGFAGIWDEASGSLPAWPTTAATLTVVFAGVPE
jgi:hypothetical protein